LPCGDSRSRRVRTTCARPRPSRFVEGLLACGATVAAFDPAATQTAREVFGDRVAYGRRPFDVVPGADALVVLTDWNDFRTPNFDRLASELKSKVVFDGRNLYEPRRMVERGFTYYSIGRAAATPT
jgi:UDPglucose 6-dehydrogenase